VPSFARAHARARAQPAPFQALPHTDRPNELIYMI